MLAQNDTKRTGEKFEIMAGLYVHYEVIEEEDKAHGYYSKEVELRSIEVLNRHHPFSDFPKEFEAWVYSQIKEQEGI